MELRKLTQNQIYSLTMGKKHWSEKIPYLMGLIRNYGCRIEESDLKYFMEEYVPSEQKRIQREYFQKSQTGVINTKFTPTDVDGSFDKITRPVIGVKYHVSWAFKGAVFVLKKIDADGIHGYMDNPRNKRDKLLKVKLSDLRKIR